MRASSLLLSRAAVSAAALFVLSSAVAANENPPPDSLEAIGEVIQVLSDDEDARRNALDYLAKNWSDGFIPMVLETSTLSRHRDTPRKLIRLLESKTNQRFGGDLDKWRKWLWSREAADHPYYAVFKATLYGLLDPRFRTYFSAERSSKIRLDEVRWGGVLQDGIPPLRNPKMIAAEEADYLDNSNIVFGIEVNGDARAYPKRILAWHEMFVDTVGGTPLAGVYCTLCGTVILYETTHDGVQHQLGTSGFLYRSNKLMYDKATQSLWNTLWGRPVIGPLADEEIQLKRGWVVTTTWGEWKRRHPETTALSLETGHQRDYSEGAAYREYFATDKLMFTVPKLDGRLKNKDEVLALQFEQAPDEQLAIAAKFLKKKPLHLDRVGPIEFVVLTDRSGANRVYESGGKRFVEFDGDLVLKDASGEQWSMTEERLESADGEVLRRLPAHRAFWFAWYAAYPETRLVK